MSSSLPERLGKVAGHIEAALELLTAVAPHVRQEPRERAEVRLYAAAAAVAALRRPPVLNDYAEPGPGPGPGPAPGAEPSRG